MMVQFFCLDSKKELTEKDIEEREQISTQINNFFYGDGTRTLVQINCPECLTYMETYMKNEDFESKDSMSCYVCGAHLEKSFDEVIED